MQLSIFEQYSNKWALELNLSKTKIMILNKQGAIIRKFRFYFQEQIIETVKQYKYLESILINKAKKSRFILQ